MRVITPDQLKSVLANLPENPRIIASGNFATPNTLLKAADENITSFQHSFVVTEQGAAACFGRTQSEQALNLITHAAHPNAKEELIAAASELKLLN
jgi:acyl-CoA hydrolase